MNPPGTVHLVYSHGPRVATPDAIGRNLGRFLGQRYPVRHYDWDERHTLKPAPGDVLVGHPHPAPWTIFRRSAAQPGWRRVLALSPYSHGDPAQVAFIDQVIERCHQYLAITGPYWFNSVAASPFAHWLPKMVHVDLAVDRHDFPRLKTSFGPPGQRRLVYIGHSGRTLQFRYKNTKYLQALAAALPELHFAWIGRNRLGLPGLVPLGYQDFSSEAGRATVAGYDFMLTVGRSDPNPTTILEAMAWGLIPVCTPQSGYSGCPGIVNVPLDDVASAAAVLRRLETLPEAELRDMQAANWEALTAHFNWDRFGQQVLDAIESTAEPALLPVPAAHRLYLRWCAWTSPIAAWRPINLLGPKLYLWRQAWRRRSGAR